MSSALADAQVVLGSWVHCGPLSVQFSMQIRMRICSCRCANRAELLGLPPAVGELESSSDGWSLECKDLSKLKCLSLHRNVRMYAQSKGPMSCVPPSRIIMLRQSPCLHTLSRSLPGPLLLFWWDTAGSMRFVYTNGISLVGSPTCESSLLQCECSLLAGNATVVVADMLTCNLLL
jgi:hypothetical protein